MLVVVWYPGGMEAAQIKVAGLEMSRRMARSIAHAGMSNVLVMGRDAKAIAASMSSDGAWAPGLEVEWAEVNASDDGFERALQKNAGLLDGTLVLVEGDRVLSPKVFDALSGARGAMAAVSPTGEVLALKAGAGEVLELEDDARDLESLAEALGATRRVVEGAHHVVVRSKAQASEAKRRLFRTLRKPLARQADGLTAYFINRPISLTISRALVHTPVTPNHVTGFNLMLALLGGALIMTAEPLMLALGAMMMQVVSIFDGIDGEIARVKLEMSEKGAWFDVLADDVARMAMYVPLGYACWVLHQQDAFLAIAGVGFTFTMMMIAKLYMDVRARGLNTANGAQWWFEAPGRQKTAWNSFLIGLSYCLKRDTYTLLLAVIAAVGFPVVSFLVMTLGINIIFFATFLQRLNRDESGELVAAPAEDATEEFARQAR